MKRILITIAASAALLGAASCTRDLAPADSIPVDADGNPLARISLVVRGGVQTKAPALTPYAGEDQLGSVEVFVFDQRPGSVTLGMLEAYKAADALEIASAGNAATVQFNTSTGRKHIYVVANAGLNGTQPLAQTITTEAELLSAVSEYSDNASGRLVMVGSACNASDGYEPVLVAGSGAANTMTVELRRLVSRIEIGEVQGDFTSPALRNSDFYVSRIYLMNVAKQARYCNGRWEDVFGVSASTGPNNGTRIDAPASFPRVGGTVFAKSATAPGYYAYAAPAADGTSADGLYNWMDATAFNPASGVTCSFQGGDFTLFKPYGDDPLPTSGKNTVLYRKASTTDLPDALAGHRYTADRYFYAYPNSSAPAANQEDVDMTTKLVIETKARIGGATQTLYYPISIGWVQPNYAYKVNKVTIKRLGSTDPFHPVSTAECTFNVTVRDWDSGDIVGQFNNEDGSNPDEFVI